MISAEEIKNLAERGESYNVDFKVTVPQKVRDITEEVCSFANAAGGYVLIGVDDRGGINYDSIPTKKYDIYAHLDSDMMKRFRRESFISNSVDDEQLLENIQAFTEEGDVKRGTILFFAKHPEDLFFHAVVRCVQFKGTDKLNIIDDKTFGGPLVFQYEQSLNWIQDKLRVEYEIKGTGPRTESWEMPLDVFREALVNALAHRDYYEQGAFTNVEVYDDRVEINNPGGLLPLVAKHFGRKSLSRNPFVFSLFMRMNMVEHVGSGIGRMHKLMVNAGLTEPEYETEGMFNIILRRKGAKSVKTENSELTELEKQVLKLMTADEKPTVEELCEKLNRKKSSIYNALKSLRSKGLLA